MNTPPPPRPLDPVIDPIDAALGTAIRNAMTRRNVSVNALHLATNLSRQTIQRSIDGIRTLDIRQFDKIARALGNIHEDLVRQAKEGAR